MIPFLLKAIASIMQGKKDEEFFFGYVVGTSLKLFLLQLFSLVLGFLLNYILVRTVDLSEYGSYVYIFNFIYLLVNFCILGVDMLLVKNISIYDTANSGKLLKGIIFFSMLVCFLGSVIVAFVSFNLYRFNLGIRNRTEINWFGVTFLSLLFLSIATVNQAVLQALKKNILSQVGERILRPVLIIAVIFFLFYFKKKILLEELIWVNVMVLAIIALLTFLFLQKTLSVKLNKIKAGYDLKNWSKAALSFFILNILYMLNSRIDILLLGILKGNEEVGVYNIALKISEIISFGFVIMNFILAPIIARLFENGDFIALQKIVTRSAQVVLLIGLPLLLVIAIFRKYILGFFGVDVLNGSHALIILCCGQFLSIFFGSVGLLLTMSGNQKFTIFSLAIGIVFNVAFNFLLTPKFGIVGTAMATAAGLGIWNISMYFFVRKRMNFRTTAFGVI